MIKLTRIYGPEGIIFIRADHISSIQQHGVGTEVVIGPISHVVTETPEQIMAMPEMLNITHPAMVVPMSATALR